MGNAAVSADQVQAALDLARDYGQTDGDHHKAWVIDQMTAPTPSAGPRTMARYRKRPVVIEAVRLPSDGLADSPQRAAEVARWCGGRAIATGPGLSSAWAIYIGTLEGEMRADPGDWIIRGVKGEFYPCKPDIFEATYEPAVVIAPTPPAGPPDLAHLRKMLDEGTPLPWEQPAILPRHFYQQGDYFLDIGRCAKPLDAALIVAAVNALPALVRIAEWATEVAAAGCNVTHGGYPRGSTCQDKQDRATTSPDKYSTSYGDEIRVGAHLCHACRAGRLLGVVVAHRPFVDGYGPWPPAAAISGPEASADAG
jgi:hypothetical protein